MPASFVWQPGPNGGTPANAANLNRHALVADIGVTGTPTGDAGRAAFGSVSQGGNRVVALGDSLTQWNDDNPVNWRRASWYSYAAVLSKQQIQYVKNAGIGGNTTAQMLARFDTDVTPYKPSTVVVLGGRNDPDAATTITNLQAIIAKVRGIGARPVLCTLPPCNTAATHVPDNTRNTWIRRYCSAQGIPLIDFRSVLVDPTNGNYLSIYNNDGTHPNDLGFQAMANAAVSTLSGVLPPYRPHLTSDYTDAANIIYRGTLSNTVTQLNAAATRTGSSPWSIPISSGTRTVAKITGDTSIIGDWVQVTDTAAAGNVQISQNLDPALAIAGHTYALSGRIKCLAPAFSGGTGLQAKVYMTGGVEIRAISDWNFAVPDGIFYAEWVMPTGIVGWEFDIVAGAGAFDVRFAQASLYDLTAMGIA